MAKKKIKKVENVKKLYETTFKHKYKVGDRVIIQDDSDPVEIKSIQYNAFDNDVWYYIGKNSATRECNIIGLAPKELLSREEKQLLRDEIKRCYDRWDECPEINEITLIRIEQDAYIAIYLISNIKEKYRCIGNFIVNSKYFKLLNSGEYYSLKKLGL